MKQVVFTDYRMFLGCRVGTVVIGENISDTIDNAWYKFKDVLFGRETLMR